MIQTEGACHHAHDAGVASAYLVIPYCITRDTVHTRMYIKLQKSCRNRAEERRV